MILSLVHVMVTLLAARRLGHWLGRFAGKWSDEGLRLCFETGLGLIFISYFLFTAACLHWLSPHFLWGLWFTLLPLAIWELIRRCQTLSGLKVSDTFWIFGGGIYLVWILLGVALPASDRDELIYQLEVPRQLLLAGGFRDFPDNFYAFFPQLANMLTLLGLGTAGESAAKLYQVSFGILLAAAMACFGRQFLSKKSALFSVLIFLTTPTIMVLMSLAYVDLAYAFYAFLALVCLLDAEKTPGQKGLATGCLLGAAAAVKYTGLQLMGLFMIFSLFQYLRDRERVWAKTIILFLMVGVLGITPYLIRNFLMTGWPLFPFPAYSFTLQPHIHWSGEQAQFYLLWLGQYGTPLGQAAVLHTVLAPVLVFLIGRFNEPQFYDGMLGPLFLLIPFLLLRSPKNHQIKNLGLFAILFLYYWAITTKQIRFLIPILPVLCLLLAYGLQHHRHFLWKGVAGFLILLNGVFGTQAILARDPIPFWLGRESRDAYLQRQLPMYTIYQQVNQQLKADDKVFLINMKNYGYYLNVVWTADFAFERYRFDKALAAAHSIEDLNSFFKTDQITHLLLDEDFLRSQWGIEPEYQPLFQQFMKQSTQLIVRDRQYALYKLR